jgi:hypothetical protein
MFGHEARYYHYTGCMLNGYYSSPTPDINLWSGPGYPILLLPFVALKLPLIAITLLNAFLFYVSAVLSFLTFKRNISFNKSAAFSVFMFLSIIPAKLNWRKLPLELRCFLLFLLLYMAASTVVSAYSRQLSVVIPVFILWFGYIFERTTQYKVKFSRDNPQFS